MSDFITGFVLIYELLWIIITSPAVWIILGLSVGLGSLLLIWMVLTYLIKCLIEWWRYR